MIRRIHLENYRCYENNSIYFKDLSIVVGKNNEWRNKGNIIGVVDCIMRLDNSGIDTTNFKRISVFKVSVFFNLEHAVNYWFEHYDALFNDMLY